MWNGPVVGRIASLGQPDPLCPPGTDELWRGGENPVALCDCNSCSAGGLECDVVLDWGINGHCDVDAIAESGCLPFSAPENGQFTLAFEISPPAGDCTPPIPTGPEFQRRGVACSPNGDACGEGGTCVQGPACIWQTGEHECPPAFEQRTVLYESFDAGALNCDACECGGGETLCEEATVSLYGAADCTGEPIAEPNTYSSYACLAYDDPMVTVLTESIGSIDIDAEPDCSSSKGAVPASGKISTANPTTLCCVQ